MSFTKVESNKIQNKRTKISIKPFFEPGMKNMGLEQYSMVLFEGVYYSEQLACLENNGIKKYITGLNEFDKSVQLLPQEEKEAKIKEIRKTVSHLEKMLAANVVDPEDEKFWEKIKLLHPQNSEFWDKIELRVSNDSKFLDINDPYDIIKIHAIEAGGFNIVAPSYEAARDMEKIPKFYLDRNIDTTHVKNEFRKSRNKALSELQTLYDKNSSKLLYLTKVINNAGSHFIKSTPNDILYESMDDYINGLGSDKKKDAPNIFLSNAKLSVKDLKLKAMIKDSTYYKFIIHKSDGYLYHAKSNTMLGKNIADIMEYFKNPLNDDILAKLTDEIDSQWNR